jgi:hypothetical protein
MHMVGTFLPDIDVFVYAALMPPPHRVTRLGEFLPFGRLLTLVSVLKFTEVAQIFFHGTSYVLISTKIL